MKQKKIEIDPELSIGMEFWIMRNNKPEMGLVAKIVITVTSCIDQDASWHTQLWNRWMNKTAKDHFKIRYSYHVKLDTQIEVFYLTKIKGSWYLDDQKIYFSKSELLETLNYVN